MEKDNKGPEQAQGGPKTKPERVPVLKIRLTRAELLDVQARAEKRGFRVLGPADNKGQLSTAGLAEYFQKIEAEGSTYDKLREEKAKLAAGLITDYGLTERDLLNARLKK